MTGRDVHLFISGTIVSNILNIIIVLYCVKRSRRKKMGGWNDKK